jgi:hypothetical protein
MSQALANLRRTIPTGSEPLIAFYRKHNGCVLYRDTLSAAAGIELFAIENMAAQTEEMYEWLQSLDDEADINHLRTAVAIGHVPESGNFFAVPIEGEKAGMVFYVDHDDWREEPFANSFDEFMDRITISPAKLLSEDLGCCTRYSDGETDTQWIPIEYFGDIDARES